MKDYFSSKISNRIITVLFFALSFITLALMIIEVMAALNFVESLSTPFADEIEAAYQSGDSQELQELTDRILAVDGFYLIINGNGEIIKSCNMPQVFNHKYTDQQIKEALSSPEMHDYSILTFYNPETSVTVIKGASLVDSITGGLITGVGMTMPILILFIGMSFLVLLVFLYVNHRRFMRLERSLKPILRAITELENGKEVALPDTGLLVEVNNAINHMSELISVQEKNRTEWISGVSHDIKNPLIMINEASERIVEEPENIDELSSRIAANVQKIKSLVDSLNLRDKLYYSLRPANVTEVNLVDLVVESTVNFMNTNDVDKYPISFDFNPALENVSIEVDPKLIDRLISNLLLNSVNNNPNGTELSLRLDQVDDGLELNIFDTGVGVRSAKLDELNKLNELKNYSGSGLGLLIAKKIANIHHMDLRFDSVYGEGFRNIIKIPLD